MSAKLFHLHIPRTGGTSLSRAVSKRVGKLRVSALPKKGVFDSQRDLQLNSQKLRDSIFLTGHYFFSEQLPLSDGWAGVTVLREPVARLVSAYRQIYDSARNRTKKHLPIHPALRRIKELSFEEFATDERGSRGLFDVPEYGFNLQTWMLAGGADPRDPELLQRARDHLTRHFRIVLTFDRLAELPRMVERAYDNKYQFELPHAKGSRHPFFEVSEDLRVRIEARNHLDVALYRWAQLTFPAEE